MDDKIWNRKSQQSPRCVCVASTKGKPHTAQRQRCVITENFLEMGIGIIPRVYERSTLTLGIASCLLLIGMVRFRIGGLFAYISRGRIIEDNLFSLTARGSLAFRRHHGVAVDRSKWMIVFERENMVKKGKRRKCLCLECERNLP